VESRTKPRAFRALAPDIWALGFVSLLMDVSSELVHSILPIFLTSVLGVGMVTVGLLEGVAEATASITKVFSGTLSDRMGKRKPLLVLGYGLAAFTKPVFPLATSVGWIFGARFTDRIGKGIRGAPRDALIADITPPEKRGAAYGLRQSLDSVGAFLGPLLAMVFLLWFTQNIRAVLWFAAIPAFLAVGLLVFGVREPRREAASAARAPIAMDAVKRLSGRYWLVVAFGAVFTLARFSEAFLVLKAQDVGLALGFIPVVMIVMNVVYALVSYPAGHAADHLKKRTLLVGGLLVLIVADLVLASATSAAQVFIGSALWGLHMGITQGLLSKLVADEAPPELRGTAFGVFNLICGVAMLLASVVAGVLWSRFGASATFLTGAAFAAVAAVSLLAYRGRPKTV
jgi:MFS family permease